MRVLVTGARGKVGRFTVAALVRAGHEVTATDLGPAVFERPEEAEPPYLQADLTDAGEADALVQGHDAVVHAAAIPDPLHHAPHRVFANNTMSAFNVIEACVRFGIRRLVNISSETVPGVVFADGRVMPPYLPIDEETPARPQDPYAFSKHVIEQWCTARWEKDGLRTISIRPSWVSHPGNYARNLGPLVREPFQDSLNFWSYTDAQDLADAIRLACESEADGHEVLYIAQPDNCTGRPLAELVERVYGDRGIDVRPTEREDASGIDSSKAQRLLGWRPTRSWRDHLDEDGNDLAG